MAREWDSEAYHRLSDPQFGWAIEVIDRLKSLRLESHGQILGAGCGTGRVTAELLRAFPQAQVTAVDASENMVREARITLSNFGLRARVETMDLLELPLVDRFDLVFSTAVFHWVKDHDRLFAVMFRALKGDGLLVAQCGGGPNLKRVRSRVQGLIQSETFSEYFADWQRIWEYRTPDLTIERLCRAGFQDVSAWLAPAPVRFSEAEEYREFAKAVILHPYLERLPEALQRLFLDELVRQAGEDNPALELDYWRLNLQGRKPN